VVTGTLSLMPEFRHHTIVVDGVTIEGENDDISGLGQTKAAHDLCTAIPDDRREHYMQPGVGHYGVFNGSRFRAQVLPRITAFINANGRPWTAAKARSQPATAKKRAAAKRPANGAAKPRRQTANGSQATRKNP